MVATSSKIRVADFFSGCGGTSAGLRLAGMDVRFALDIDPEAASTYRRNFPGTTFAEQDVAELDIDTVATAVGSGPGPLLISACAPCQPYSTFVGQRRKDPRRSLLLRLLPFIDELKPSYVFLENVPGLKTANANAGTFSRFCKHLREQEYTLTSSVVGCQSYGVPQRRRRLILLASLEGRVDIPEATHGSGTSNPLSTVWQWIGDLPKLGAGESNPDVSNHLASAISDLNLRRLRATPVGGGRNDWPEELRLECHKGHSGHCDVYGRMNPDGQAPVLTTKCTSISNGRFGHPYQDRPISVREAASLQTFPRTFVFNGGIKAATRQVGNAVPVLVAQRMGEAFVRHYEEIGTEREGQSGG